MWIILSEKMIKDKANACLLSFLFRFIIIRIYPTGGLKAQQAHSPGYHPGEIRVGELTPCKGKSSNMINSFAPTGRNYLLPFS